MDKYLRTERIDIDEARALRHRIFHPSEDRDFCCNCDGDTSFAALHLGLFVDNVLIGTASCVPDVHTLTGTAWRQREFGIIPEFRGNRFAAPFYTAFRKEMEHRGMCPSWATVKESLLGFYQMFGARDTGETVMFPCAGLHHVVTFR